MELEPINIVRLYDKMQRYIVPGYETLLREISNLIGRTQPSNFVALDLGCGTGNLAHHIVRQYPESTIVCIDRSLSALSFAKSKLLSVGATRIQFVQIDFIEQALFGNYNTVVSSFVMHHVPESRIPVLLKQIYDVLTPNGVCLIGDTVRVKSSQQMEQIRSRYDRFLKGNITKGYITQKDIYQRSTYMSVLEELGIEFFKPVRLSFILNMFERAGFRNVQCQYQDGNLAIFGGAKVLPPKRARHERR